MSCRNFTLSLFIKYHLNRILDNFIYLFFHAITFKKKRSTKGEPNALGHSPSHSSRDKSLNKIWKINILNKKTLKYVRLYTFR